MRINVLVALRKFLTERFQIDDELFEKIEPFVKFEKDANIEAIHSSIAPDLNLANLYLQFSDFSNQSETVGNKSLNEVITHLAKTDGSRELYKELLIVLARIAACTPHSADVERCISAN